MFYEIFTEQRAWKNDTANRIIISLSQEKSPFEAKWENIISSETIKEAI